MSKDYEVKLHGHRPILLELKCYFLILKSNPPVIFQSYHLTIDSGQKFTKFTQKFNVTNFQILQ